MTKSLYHRGIALALRALKFVENGQGMPKWLDKIHELSAGDVKLEEEAVAHAMAVFGEVVGRSFFKDKL